MKELRKQLDNQQAAKWDDLIRMESHLIPFIRLHQKTLRAAKIIPTFAQFEFGEIGWRVKRGCSSESWKKLRAWWDLILEAQRNDGDIDGIKLAVAYAVQRQMVVNHGKFKPVIHQKIGVFTEEFANRIQLLVCSTFNDLVPCEVATVNAEQLLAAKYEAQPKE